MNEEEERAIETMKHWIEYEKANKNKINKADELIEMQETVLNLLEKKDKIIDEMANSFAEEGFYSEHCQTLIDNEICPNDCNKCVKQYFERKVE